MVPRIGYSTVDALKWNQPIESVRKRFQNDPNVKLYLYYIELETGEHPMLPFDGHHFLRSGSKISGLNGIETKAAYYVRTVIRITNATFRWRILEQPDSLNQYRFYYWREVHDSIRSFPRGIGLPKTLKPSNEAWGSRADITHCSQC
ncbi:hypothetical protein BKA67DRAFT_542150 [Truncatella angustata]|uniref:Uncharacterized protein n=1 Tax=Truncatella angustata TaxID=152316 RepID=A0A9P8UBP1_9PEZI|nr:uncharacterized protein BKA67DRAFT_542150 [Truncatella angustata]KAH6645170.1 hypothetical protein BKA67DRAFT_542150 [Truncatella angustata]